MLRALWSAATGMYAQQLRVDTLANNLANVNTVGFKKMRVDFQDLFYQTVAPAGARTTSQSETTTGIQIGMGTRPVATQKIFLQGEYESTENPLDMVIEGAGFFQVTMPDGTIAYTRAGDFKKNADGMLVTSDGYYLEPSIVIPENASEVHVGSDGTISVRAGGEIQTIGTMELARFVNPAGLMNIGRNLFVATAASGDAIVGTPGTEGFGTLAQGVLEMSNVKVVEEMVNMITAQRAYEINSKVIKTADDMIALANNMVR
jgi:flagellar basal-body rod protein FlgG